MLTRPSKTVAVTAGLAALGLAGSALLGATAALAAPATTAPAPVSAAAPTAGAHPHVSWLRTMGQLIEDGVITAEEAQAVARETRDQARDFFGTVRRTALAALVADRTLTPAQAALLAKADDRQDLRHIVRDLVRSGRLDRSDAAAVARAFRAALPADRPTPRTFLLAALDTLVADATLTKVQADAIAAAFPGRSA